MSRYLEFLVGRARHEACVAQDRAMAVHVRRGNDRVAQNDEPEPSWEQICAEAQEEVRRLTSRDRALAEKFGGKPFDLLPTLDALPAEFDRRKP